MAKEEKATRAACALASLEDTLSVELRAEALVEVFEVLDAPELIQRLEVLDAMERHCDL